MNTQLHLTAIELIDLGFTGKNVEEKRIYEMRGLNSRIYYNPEEKKYAWYYETIIGEAGIHIILDLNTPEDLLKFIKIMGFKRSLI